MTYILPMNNSPYPMGPSRNGEYVNFTLYAPHAQVVKLYIVNTSETYTLHDKTGDVWHISLPLKHLQIQYHFVVDDTVTLDPFAREIVSSFDWGVVKPSFSQFSENVFDWEGVEKPHLPKEKLVIYEMHTRGFTQDPSSGVEHPGKFLGIIEKIPHFLNLGINAIELLPVQEFNELENKLINPLSKEPLYNYWGYSPVNYFALMNRYGVKNTVHEFKTLVKELHRFGIEVIVDVVYNHTSVKEESCYTTLAPETYYVIDGDQYNNESGCGNTLNTGHPFVQELVISSLRYMASELKVDGFRFDLATILKRDSDALIKAISDDPILKDCKLIAEPWDMHRYQVGQFSDDKRWSEWNDKYRDTLRSFFKGDNWKKGEFATRFAGSEDLFHKTASASSSVNFVTSHDGFSLRDLVSYNSKHNLANGEGNRDGLNNNISWNCGKEGATDDRVIVELRDKQMKNFLVSLLLSKGIPMLTMGDEYGHTKVGNNNTWCQDNTLSWFNWKEMHEESSRVNFVSKLIKLRRSYKEFTSSPFLTSTDIEWHGTSRNDPAWDRDDKFIAFTLKPHFWMAFNASNKTLAVDKPEGEWEFEILSTLHTPKLVEDKVIIEPHSSVVMKRKV